MKKKKLYKVLKNDLTSPYKAFQYKLNKKYHCKNFDDNIKNDCSQGFYVVDLDGLPYCYNINRKIFEVEVWGRKVEFNQFKRRYEYYRILREVPKSEILSEIKKRKLVDYNLEKILFPVNPLMLPKAIPTSEDIGLLSLWASVRDSVWVSVRDSVKNSAGDYVWASARDSVGNSVGAFLWDSVKNSVGNSVWASADNSTWDSVWDSVEDSVGAFIGSCFPKIKEWKYTYNENNTYPFHSSVKLWERGFVPAITEKELILCSGKKAEIVYRRKKNK